MRNPLPHFTALTILITAILFPLGAQDVLDEIGENTPVWIIFQQGKKAFDEREYGDALTLFREAIRREEKGQFPEAEYYIGRIFEAEGELTLAEQQYEEALLHRDRLSVPEDVNEIRYRLIHIYSLTGRKQRFYQDNMAMLTRSELYGNPEVIEDQHHRMNKTFLEEGLDYLLVLYRPELTFEREALRNLAFYHFEREEYQEAAFQLMVLCTSVISRTIEQYRSFFPDYRFESEEGFSSYSMTAAFLRRIDDRPLLNRFLEKSEFYKMVYYWGNCLSQLSQTERAEDLWFLIADRGDVSGIWGKRSLQQLNKPEMQEQVLDLN